MTPEEIRSVVDAAIHDGLRFPFWSYILAALFSPVGAFFGAYFKRKAENRAADENFKTLRDQLQKTTRDTEEIKNALSREAWITQQHWNIRERFYSELVTNLALLKLFLKDQVDYFDQPGSEHNASIDKSPHFERLALQGAEAFAKVREHVGPASIFLSEKTIKSLQDLFSDHWSISMNAVCTAEYVSEFLNSVSGAYSAVLTEARHELGNDRKQT